MVLKGLLGEGFRGLSRRIAECPLFQWFCAVDELIVDVPSKSTLKRYAGALPPEKLAVVIDALTLAAAGGKDASVTQPLELAHAVELDGAPLMPAQRLTARARPAATAAPEPAPQRVPERRGLRPRWAGFSRPRGAADGRSPDHPQGAARHVHRSESASAGADAVISDRRRTRRRERRHGGCLGVLKFQRRSRTLSPKQPP